MNKNMKAKAVVLFYPTGIVHMRNLEVLRKILPGYRFLVIVESWMKKSAPEVLKKIEPGDRVMVEKGKLPKAVWKTPVDILFLSMAYPNPFRLHLVYEAAKRNIPVTAIEEVNQLALNDGIINHYFLPIDYFGVPSEVEKKKFVELGLPGASIRVTGWPFFDKAAVLKPRDGFKLRETCKIAGNKKCCLLVLGSLKESDIVSLETRGVRHEILDVVSRGLRQDYQLLIKPHPVETEAALEDIKKQVPDAVVLDPKLPIEPVLAQADLVVNRGNSQVTLLAMLQGKPLIVVPVGMRTIFHGPLDSLIADSPSAFSAIQDSHFFGGTRNYKRILDTHFPLTERQAPAKVKELFRAALEKETKVGIDKKIYISILFAFLGDISQARQVANGMQGQAAVTLLMKLYDRAISVEEFKTLLEQFTGKIIRWHLQALFIRHLLKVKDKKVIEEGISLLEGFDCDVNPHYFIDEMVGRIELEYKSGREAEAKRLFEKFCNDYSVFPYYKQAFDMLDYVYRRHPKHPRLSKTLWLLKNWNKNYTRHYIKKKI
jgi:hypothetical protein